MDDCFWNKSFENVEYDAVSFNLMDYVLAEMTVFEDDSTNKYGYRGILLGTRIQLLFGMKLQRKRFSQATMEEIGYTLASELRILNV